MGTVEVSNKIELICIGCPLGCKEVTNPTRIVTSIVRVKNGNIAVVSVKTKEDIPKAKIHDCIKALKDVEVEAPIKIGDVLVSNIAGTGVDIVATRNIRKKQ